MSVDKVIIRAFLSTLAAVAALLVFMVLSLCIAFPATMMKITYNLGMENSSIHFAERAYKGNEDIYFISYATEVAIVEGKQDKIISCGQKFIANGDFDTFCKNKDEDYGQYIRGEICVAKYQSGDKENAISDAFAALEGSFPQKNAVISLMLAAIEGNDKETVSKIVDKLNGLSVEGEQAYLTDMKEMGTRFLTK